MDGFYATFPFDKSQFAIELWESGNAPDYSYIFAPGVQAARGDTEGYTIKNAPKGDPITTIEVTGNSGSDIMKYNYIKIDYASIGDGVKWYFVKGKRMLNYPDPLTDNWYAVEFTLELDYWETYKDMFSPVISLSRVTTSAPGDWNETEMINEGILGFNDENITYSPMVQTEWKTIVAWQAKQPTDQDAYVLDGMQTTLQYSDNGDLDDYLDGLVELTSGASVAEAEIWRTFVSCTNYVVQDFFTTTPWTNTPNETLAIPTPLNTAVHKRLQYYPYRRVFGVTLDGQRAELEYPKLVGGILPTTWVAQVYHSTTPTPRSLMKLSPTGFETVLLFDQYPSMDITGKATNPLYSVTKRVLDNLATPFMEAGKQQIGNPYGFKPLM